ncbi:hypothetical protein [Nostoc sp.]|uniref:hypothetical protein n=1 Tax=Nostoc sp. TaxID=1180 RepID=UPI002FFAF5FC
MNTSNRNHSMVLASLRFSSNQGQKLKQQWLNLPLEQISIEMVFRSLYFFNRACLQNPQLELISWLVENHRLMGLVKAVRKRHRDNAKRSLDIWEPTLT